MIDLVLKAVQKLKANGFGQDDRIAILSENRIETIVLALSCWKLGAVIVPMSTRYPECVLRQALDDVDCRDVIVSDSVKKPEVTELRFHAFEDILLLNTYETSSIKFEQFGLDLAQDASILFTSGSGGHPKGVLHTIGNHYYSALGALENIPFEQGDRWLMTLPMYHISGFSLIMRSLIKGGALVFPKQGQSVLDALMAGGITHISVVPAQLRQWLQIAETAEALQQCKSVLLGGAAAGELLVKEALDQGIQLSTTYGSTEAASQVTTSTPQTLAVNPTLSGRVLPYRQLAISTDGEILLKGETLFKGYILESRLDCPFDQRGWFHTCDVGSLDSKGLLTVIGRKDRMFISGGENIYPEQIEKALVDIDSVEQVYVVSVPDSVMGARPVAFIKTISSGAIDPETLTRHLEQYLERFKIPIAFLPWPITDSESFKPDASLFQSLAIKAIKSCMDS
jgi:O-succinylbenzoic acid--CoA ligase